jgi:chromosome segregation ATPase
MTNKLEKLKKEMEETQTAWEVASIELNKMTNKLEELQNEIDEIAILHNAKQDTYNVFNDAAKVYCEATLGVYERYQTAYETYETELNKNNEQ